MVPFYKHQRDALRYASKRSSIALFMEMRLGKSRVAIEWARRKRPDSILIVGPKCVLPGWEDELALFGEQAYWATAGRQLPEKPRGWWLTNYEQLIDPGHRTPSGKPKAVPRPIAVYPWDVVILDESIYIRNPQAQTTRVVREHLGRNCRYRAVLTGLPNPEGPLDFFEQMAFLNRQFCGCRSYWDFRKTFFLQSGFNWAPRLGTRQLIREAVHQDAFVLSRKEAGMGNVKTREVRYVDLHPTLMHAYRQLEAKFATGDVTTKWVVAQHTLLMRLCGGALEGYTASGPPFRHYAKVLAVLEVLEHELRNASVVIWFRFNSELDLMAQSLARYDITYRMIVGATRLADRQRYCREFDRKQVRVLLCQIKCCQFGVNFSKADAAFYFSNSASGNERAQSEARLAMPGKQQALLYIDFLVRNTVDEDTYNAVRLKKAGSTSVLKKVWKLARERVRKAKS